MRSIAPWRYTTLSHGPIPSIGAGEDGHLVGGQKQQQRSQKKGDVPGYQQGPLVSTRERGRERGHAARKAQAGNVNDCCTPFTG